MRRSAVASNVAVMAVQTNLAMSTSCPSLYKARPSCPNPAAKSAPTLPPPSRGVVPTQCIAPCASRKIYKAEDRRSVRKLCLCVHQLVRSWRYPFRALSPPYRQSSSAPRLLQESSYQGNELDGRHAGSSDRSPRNIQIWQDYSSPDFSVEQGFDLDSLARMMAKIAHATCVVTFGLDWFTPWLPPYILGADAALSYVVGGAEGPLEPKNTLHEIRYDVTMIGGILLVTCAIRLFAQFGGPHTKVIVGQTTEECVQSFNRKSANVAPLESGATQQNATLDYGAVAAIARKRGWSSSKGGK